MLRIKATLRLAVSTLATAMLVFGFTACHNDDDNKYRSVFPTYIELISSPEVIHVGDSVTFTLVERTHGTNLGSARYTWSVGELWENAQPQYTTPRLYSESSSPTMKILATTRGTHEIVFTAQWSVNGQAMPAPAPYTYQGLLVTSTTSTLNYFVTARKKFTVLP
ncbi:MAG: hypothetical protein Q4A44_01935 [Bacteroidales bacterium]|nr:hypothetical protein [Bacteroidales bacterium]